ncbi:MAG TPA: hypothetical protein ENI42_03225 [Thermoplasmatales archaeon]|nr:hypothetical protein [Thermoplasmatales archaeon]
MVKKTSFKLYSLFSLRQEILLTPVIVFTPLVVSLLFFYNAVYNVFLCGNMLYVGEFFVGSTILVGNLVFALPFLKAFFRVRKG